MTIRCVFLTPRESVMKRMFLSIAITALALLPGIASAHFIWLVPGSGDSQSKVYVYFGEDAEDSSPDYLARVADAKLLSVAAKGQVTPLTLVKTDSNLTADSANVSSAVVVAIHDMGVLDRGDSKFRLKYYAKTGPDAASSVWQQSDCADQLALDVVPNLQGAELKLLVHFQKQPAVGADIKVIRPGADDFEGTTDASGMVTLDVADAGLYAIRTRFVEAVGGHLEDQSYPETRHYTTVTLPVSKAESPGVADRLQPLPQPVTSFGAAVLDDALYTYGGHTGGAHSYSDAEQGRQLMQLNLKTGIWKGLAEGPGLQGLALVAHGNRLYRIGGFTAKNAEGEDHNLWSQNDVASIDPETAEWTELPPLPERRSSHDAAVVGDAIYVVGGWAMSCLDQTQWHSTAWKLDLKQQPLHWQPIAAPPFERRALAAAANHGKLYIIGGMNHDGGPTTETAVYDPASDAWSKGPSLYVKPDPEVADGEEEKSQRRNMSGGAMTGFGASAFATGGHLYVTTVQGTLQRLSDDGSQWELVSGTPTGRFFHRLLPLDQSHLLVVGGSNMSTGKFEEVEVLDVTAKTPEGS